ncbi:MAG: CCA tRNA nucleotidyltransferase [Alphaproteobacteria bacterium]
MNKIKLNHSAELKTVFDIAKQNGFEARIVGGAVREYLFGNNNVYDIDLAINATPDKVTEIFETAGHRVIPTGIDFGTITVIIDQTPFEITSLRKDMETDGRKAVVSYTDNWQDDSIRRDFTINAIYVDEAGNVYDYHNGINDFENKKLNFVGGADVRIKEDALRILRLFRFAITTGFDVDDETYTACKNNAVLIKKLSIERIANEMIKMLKSKNFNVDTIFKMRDVGILQSIIPMAVKSELPLFNNTLLGSNDYIAKIIALSDGNFDMANTICNVWKLSNKEKRNLKETFTIYNDRTFVPQFLNKFLYYNNYEALLSASLLKDEKFYQFVKDKTGFEKPIFPVDGNDLLALGFEKGAKLGSLLKAVERWWVDNEFKPKKQDCLLYAKQKERM